MATVYGSWVTISGANMYRAVVETSQTSGNTQSTVTMTVKIQYGTSSAVTRWAQFLTTSLTISSNLNGTTQSATATASPTPGGTQTLVTRNVTVNKTHAAQSVATNATVGTASGSGHPATSSAASGSVSVSAKTSWKVTYKANGGDADSVPATQTKWYGESLTLSSTIPTRAGFTFLGWNTNAKGTGTHYSAGQTYTGNAALTLYAMWLGVSVPSIECERTDSTGTEADEGTYGTVAASWQASGTVAATVAVTARNATAARAITLSGNTSGSVAAGGSASGTVSALFGADAGQSGSLSTDNRYTVTVTVTATTTYNGGSTVTKTATAYVPYAYITIDIRKGGHGVTFGATAVEDGFHCYMPATFHDEVNGTWRVGTAASTAGAVTTLPAAGTYLLATGHNSTPELNGLWMIRTSGNTAFKLAGGGNVTVTVSGTSVTVKTTAGTVATYYQQLG